MASSGSFNIDHYATIALNESHYYYHCKDSIPLVLLLSKDFLMMVVVAIMFAIPLWWVIGQWLENYPYRIDMNWSFFAIAAFVALLVALATIAGQSWLAAVRNPVDALKNE
jgi:putative ABC transport system permease protein